MSQLAAPLMIVSSGISAIGSIQAGAAQRRAYDEQAAQAEMRGRSEAIAYKQQGADVLRNLNQNLAAIIARSAVGGGLDGSAGVLQEYAFSEAAREKYIAADNAILAEGQASSQASQYRMAGRAAQTSGYIQAIGTIGSAAYRYGQLA